LGDGEDVVCLAVLDLEEEERGKVVRGGWVVGIDSLVATGWLLRGTPMEYWAPAAPMNVTWTTGGAAFWGVGRALVAAR
jgi:hypothetical protein